MRTRQSLRGELEVLVRDTETTSRITAAEGPRNAGVLLQWFGTRCHGRCRHCLLRNTGRVCSLPFARAAAIADRFLAWREREKPPDFLVQLGGGYSDDFPHFAELVAFCRERELPTPAYFSVNGIAFRSDAEIAGLLEALTGLGQTGIHLTLFGVGEAHDRFAGRRGDFAFLLRFARRAAEAGFERTESIFLTQRNQGELLTLVEKLSAIPGMAQRRLWLLDYRGRAKSLERERITAAALAALPDSLRQYFRMGPPRPIHTEAEWIARLQAGDVPRKTARCILLPIAEDNVEYLETSDPGEVMEAIWEAEDQFRQSLPSLLELSRLYGRRAGRRLYERRDLEWKWTDAYLAQHPELDRSRAFDDTRVSVITH